MHPIASIQATEMTRRALRGSGPGDAVADRASRRPARKERGRRRARAAGADVAPRPVRPAATVNLVEARAQSGSDQCSIVAAGRNPARA